MRGNSKISPIFVHECYFTLLLNQVSPVQVMNQDLNSDPQDPAILDFTKNEILNDALIKDSENILMALSVDSRSCYCNKRAEEEIFSGLIDPGSSGVEFDMEWIAEKLAIWDRGFERRLPLEEWPVYRAGVLGERLDRCVVGIIDHSGKRKLLEFRGRPIVSHKMFPSSFCPLPLISLSPPPFPCSSAE